MERRAKPHHWRSLKSLLQVPEDRFRSRENKETGENGRQWSNHDLDPTPPEERTWSFWVYAAFWMAHAMNASAWTAGSATVTLGLKWWQTWMALNVSHIIGTALVVANGRMGARYHVGFPICARSAWGMWGSYMAVIMRGVVCIIWNGVNTFYAGRLVDVCLQCIWPSWRNVPNHIPESSGITTRQLISFLIAWIIFQSLTVIHPRNLKVFYIVKSVIVFVAMHGILVWFMIKNGGASLNSSVEPSLSSSKRAWLWFQAFNTGFGTLSSLTVNQADIARYARRPSDQLWGQVITFPLASALPGLYGILVSSASKNLFGKPLWSLWDITQAMLDQYQHNSGARFGIFLAAGSMALALIAVNLATNCLPFGSDVTALFPRYMTIRRGQFICCLLGLAIAPWKILKDGTTFLTFLSGYGYWLAPGAAILCVDYFLIKRGNIVVPDLYNGTPLSRYWYTKGWNIRAPVVTILSLVPCMPGFAAAISPSLQLADGARNMFYLSFLLTYAIGAVLYAGSYVVYPERVALGSTENGQLKFEALADALDEEERTGAVLDVSAFEDPDISSLKKGEVVSESVFIQSL